MRTLRNIFVSGAMLFLCGSAWADDRSIQGIVIGINGQPVSNAEVRAERLEPKATPVVTRTDAKGHYAFSGLPKGSYSVSATVKGAPKRQANVRTRDHGSARVDFDLRSVANGKNGGGKPSGSPANRPETDDVSRLQGKVGGTINNMSFPGH